MVTGMKNANALSRNASTESKSLSSTEDKTISPK